ncbi:recombination regulator RecX [Streptococcus uberis]|uniref:recombination regulator RecX n=1 Tax=Streptococcus uberis TaxID=1349 RepID=UPI001FF2593F|nr:recombination regulator RecX [Streptococcus uberis]MCK1189353.1 recombination regulator RecX [Streptococcus uberis]
MKIQKIEKKKRLYLLECDNGDSLYVTEDTIVHFMLSKGMEITPEQLESIKQFAQFSYGKNLALYYISFQVRTQKQVYDYLKKHDLENTIIQKIIEELIKENWINDQKYVESILRQNMTNGDKGPQLIKQKLMQKGISDRIIEKAISEVEFYPIAEKVALKMISRYQDKLPRKALQDKLTQLLINKGFSYDMVKAVNGNLSIETDQENTLSLLEKEADKQLRKLSKRYEGYALRQKLFQTLYRKGYDSDDIQSLLSEIL